MLATVYGRASMRRLLPRRPIMSMFIMLCMGFVLARGQNSTEEASRSSLNLPLNLITLPPGFRISMYYDDYVPGARSMTLSKGDNGNATIVYVGTRDKWSTVYALVDLNSDGKAEKIVTILSGLNQPNGVAWREGSLYVAEVSRVTRYDNADWYVLNNKPFPAAVVVSTAFPTDGAHGWKYIAFGPDDKLYVPVGAPCNVCQLDEWAPGLTYGDVTRMNADGSGLEQYASGIRNTVGFDWDPATNYMWMTNNGRDSMGDNVPDDTLLFAPRPGLFFGFPYCYWVGAGDPYNRTAGPGTVGTDNSAGAAPEGLCTSSRVAAPSTNFGPHVAALGMKFYRGGMFPPSYYRTILVALHGSWNRQQKIGYRVDAVRVDPTGKTLSQFPFASGWLQGQDVWGRPVDVLELPDGSILVSDDFASAVYRITFENSA